MQRAVRSTDYAIFLPLKKGQLYFLFHVESCAFALYLELAYNSSAIVPLMTGVCYLSIFPFFFFLLSLTKCFVCFINNFIYYTKCTYDTQINIITVNHLLISYILFFFFHKFHKNRCNIKLNRSACQGMS